MGSGYCRQLGSRPGCLWERLSQTLSQLGGGWVCWGPREAASQGHTAFGCRAVTEGISSLSAFLACVTARSQAQQKPTLQGAGKGDLGGGTLAASE